MDFNHLLLWLLLALFISVNTFASYLAAKTHFEIKQRRFYQLLFIWFVPVIGALMVIYFYWEELFNQKPKPQVGNNPNISDSQAITMANHTDGSR